MDEVDEDVIQIQSDETPRVTRQANPNLPATPPSLFQRPEQRSPNTRDSITALEDVPDTRMNTPIDPSPGTSNWSNNTIQPTPQVQASTRKRKADTSEDVYDFALRYANTPPGVKSVIEQPLRKNYKIDQAALQVVPVSIVLMPVAQGMLIMGSHMKADDCAFPLSQYLTIAGSVSLGLGTLGVLAPHLFAYLKRKHRPEHPVPPSILHVVAMMKFMSQFLLFSQIVILIMGLIIILPHVVSWQSTDKTKSDYCEYGPFIFTLIYLCMAGLIIILGAISIFYVRATRGTRRISRPY